MVDYKSKDPKDYDYPDIQQLCADKGETEWLKNFVETKQDFPVYPTETYTRKDGKQGTRRVPNAAPTDTISRLPHFTEVRAAVIEKFSLVTSSGSKAPSMKDLNAAFGTPKYEKLLAAYRAYQAKQQEAKEKKKAAKQANA